MPYASAITNYANAIIGNYTNAPIALDRLDPLVCMTVGAGRIKLLNDIYSRVCTTLSCGGAGGNPAFGMKMEAITGEYGAGKSHIGYMLKQNVLSVGEDVLIAHVQITGAARFQEALASILRALQVSNAPSLTVNGVEVGAYRRLFDWYSHSELAIFNAVRDFCGNLPVAAARDFARGVLDASSGATNATVLQLALDAWVAKAEPRAALEMFLLVMRLFIGVGACRLVLIIDEFEAIQHLPAHTRRAILQSFQDLHDSFSKQEAGSLAAYMLLFSTDDWIQQVDATLPSFGSGNRLRSVTPLPDLCVTDIRALVYKSFYFHLMGDTSAIPLTEEQLEAVCKSVIEAAGGKRYHLRSIQRNIHEEFGRLMHP